MDQDPREEEAALVPAPARNQIARQDFGGTSLEQQNGATAALVAKARATVEASIIAAKRWPRNKLDARDRVLGECKRPEFAAAAMYSVPRGEGRVEGLSIRFAEMALQAMGNMEATSETIYDDATSRMIRVRVVDYETNASVSVDFTVTKTKEVKRLKQGQRALGERTNSFGDRIFIVDVTDDDVTVKQNAAVSKAMRTGILRLIPADIRDEAKAVIRRTTADKDAKDPAGARKRMLDAFAEIGVKPSAIEIWLGHPIDTITQEEGGELKDLHNAIKIEREITWDEALANRLSERGDKAKAKPPTVTPAPAAPGTTAAEPEPEQRRAEPAGDRAKSSGRGTAALKAAMRPSDPGSDAAYRRNPKLPPDTPPPSLGYEYRGCAGCEAIVEVPIEDKPGALCDVCRQV